MPDTTYRTKGSDSALTRSRRDIHVQQVAAAAAAAALRNSSNPIWLPARAKSPNRTSACIEHYLRPSFDWTMIMWLAQARKQFKQRIQDALAGASSFAIRGQRETGQ